MVTPLLIQTWLLRAALLLLVLLLVRSRQTLRETGEPIPALHRYVLLGVVLFAAALRLWGSVWGFHHENAHGYHLYSDALLLDERPHFPIFGAAGYVLYQAALTIGPAVPGTLFWLNFVLATVSVLLAYLAGRALVQDSRAGLVAALLLATHPTHIRMSASESLFVPLVFFALLGIYLWQRALAGGRRTERLFLPAALALVLASQTRTLAVTLVVPVVLLWLLGERPLRRLRRPAFLGAVAIAAGLSLIHAAELLREVQGGGDFMGIWAGLADAPALLMSPARNALIDPATTPLALWAAALLGAVGLAWRRPRMLVVILAALLVTAAFNIRITDNAVNRLRFSLPVAMWAVLLSSGAALLLPAGLRWQRLAAGALVALSLAGLWFQRDVYLNRYDVQREGDFIASAIERLPDRGTLVTLDHAPSAAIGVNPKFPTAWLWARGKLLRRVDGSQWLALEDREPGAIWYQGIACWAYAPGELEGQGYTTGMRPLCRTMAAMEGIEAIVETTFVPNPDVCVVPSPQITIGFYRLP